jgi:hypothetical protein
MGLHATTKDLSRRYSCNKCWLKVMLYINRLLGKSTVLPSHKKVPPDFDTYSLSAGASSCPHRPHNRVHLWPDICHLWSCVRSPSWARVCCSRCSSKRGKAYISTSQCLTRLSPFLVQACDTHPHAHTPHTHAGTIPPLYIPTKRPHPMTHNLNPARTVRLLRKLGKICCQRRTCHNQMAAFQCGPQHMLHSLGHASVAQGNTPGSRVVCSLSNVTIYLGDQTQSWTTLTSIYGPDVRISAT